MGRHRTAAEKVTLGEQARAMRAAGQSRRDITHALHVGDDLLTEFLRGTDVPESLRRPRAKDDHREAALALRQQGRTYDEIAAELNVSKGTLSLWLRAVPHPTNAQRARTHTEPTTVEQQMRLFDPSSVVDRVTMAREMRLDGLLLREIAAALSVSVKTACVWCTDLPVPPRARHGGNLDHVRMMARKRWDAVLAERDAERVAVKASAASSVGQLSNREVELLAATAYWCEGSKDKPYDRREKVTFINSDADLIALWLEFLRRRGYGVDRLRLNLSIHESADLDAATAYWAEIAGVEPEFLGKPMLKRHNPKTNRKNTSDAYVGCLIVRVLQGRQLYQEIEGLWRGIVAGMVPPARRMAS